MGPFVPDTPVSHLLRRDRDACVSAGLPWSAGRTFRVVASTPPGFVHAHRTVPLDADPWPVVADLVATVRAAIPARGNSGGRDTEPGHRSPP